MCLLLLALLVEYGLNPILSLLPHFTGHPTYQLLCETFRNQVCVHACMCVCVGVYVCDMTLSVSDSCHSKTTTEQPNPADV